MTRTDFTKKIADLILKMLSEDEDPILDFIKRSDEEQKRLFDAGKSKCDGKTIISQHQRGKAADIYFLNPESQGLIGPPKKGDRHWHKIWEDMGGKPMIPWDKGHFEG